MYGQAYSTPNHNVNGSTQGNEMISNMNDETTENQVKFSKEMIDTLYNKLSTKIIQKNDAKHNLEIQVDFRNDLGNNLPPAQNLGAFITTPNPPTLFFDLTDSTYELELKLNELLAELTEKTDKIKKHEKKLQDYEKTIKDYSLKLKDKETHLTFLKSQEIENESQIKELVNQKNTLIQSLPNKLEGESKKNLPLKEYRELKFTPTKIDDSYITKTLEKDLVDYKNYIKAEMSKKNVLIDRLVQNIRQTVNGINKDFDVQLYGSFATGLCLPWSDLDVVLVYNGKTPIQASAFLTRLYSALGMCSWCKERKYSDNTSISSISLFTSAEFGNIRVDMTINDEKNYGLKCVELIKSYLTEYVVLEPLILALKTILKNANLNNPYTGGLSSYGLILMVVSFIQSKMDEKFQDQEDLIGKTFYGFLGHYGVFFDYNKYVILTYPINDLNKESIDQDSNLNFGQNLHELIIVDPLNKQNNVAKKTYQFMNLKMAFMIAFMVTKEDCECGCHFGKAANEHSLTSTEHCILKRMFNSVKRFTDSK